MIGDDAENGNRREGTCSVARLRIGRSRDGSGGEEIEHDGGKELVGDARVGEVGSEDGEADAKIEADVAPEREVCARRGERSGDVETGSECSDRENEE